MAADLEMFSKVLLKTGETAYVVEIFDNGAAYDMDVDRADGSIETIPVRPEEIERKLR